MMSVEDPWKPFRDVMQNPWEYARAWKERTRGKVVGHLLPDVPEEIIHAAGALPVAIEGAGIYASHAQAHIPGYTCNHAMGALELGLRGDLAVLDGMVIPYVCDTTRNLFHIWDRCFPDMANEFLRIPKRIGHPKVESYLTAEFQRFAGVMQNLTGESAGPDRFVSTAALYRKSRARLREAYDRHRQQPSVWTADRINLLTASALRADRAEHLEWMEALPWEDHTAEDSSSRIRLYVRGKVWDPPGILEMLDSLGFIIGRDEIVTGFRSIEQHGESSLDPMETIVRSHLRRVPYPGYHIDPAQAVEGFVARVREATAAAVLLLNPKFCEAAAFDTPDLQVALEKAGIPSLVLETSARGVSLGQIRIRLEAFQEMVSGELP
ncbi:MAG: 2-hydroxyacyl-CoA dehydratase [Desulfomonile tiedjei]|nr:2-hydroxyacyl-CoA dehydratase [Desulfomonile tiedjei]